MYENLISEYANDAEKAGVKYLRADQLFCDPNQPREKYDPEHVNSLGISMAATGQWRPLDVIDMGDDRFMVMNGNNRALAFAYMPELSGVLARCNVVRVASEAEKFLLQYQDNLLQQGLRDLNQVRADRRAVDEFGFSLSKVASSRGVSEKTVESDFLLLKLPKALQDAVDAGSMPKGVGREIATLFSDETKMVKAWDMARVCKHSEKMLARVRDYKDRLDQKPLIEGDVTNDDIGKAYQAFNVLKSALGKFGSSKYANGHSNLVVKAFAKKNQLDLLGEIMKSMEKVQKDMRAAFDKHEARAA